MIRGSSNCDRDNAEVPGSAANVSPQLRPEVAWNTALAFFGLEDAMEITSAVGVGHGAILRDERDLHRRNQENPMDWFQFGN
jgi:hypothetical protein